MAGQRYFGLKTDRAGNAADLKAALGGLKGPLMKVAQIMATIPDALPKEYVQELETAFRSWTLDVVDYASATDSGGCVLAIRNVSRKAPP